MKNINKNIFILSLLSFGIQFVNSLLLTNMSIIYKFFDVPGYKLALLGLIAPLSGLVIQPIVGQMSDLTFSRFGKRKPYLFLWGILIVLSCFLIPFSKNFYEIFILICILSCSINGAAEILRALTGDLTNNKYRIKAFSLQSIFSGFGAGIVLSIIYNLKLIDFHKINLTSLNNLPFEINITFFISSLQFFFIIFFFIILVNEKHKNYFIKNQKNEINTKLDDKYNLLKFIILTLQQLILKIKKSPAILKKLSLIQFFTWVGLYGFWIYFGIAISQAHHHLPLHIEINNHQYHHLLQQGAIDTNFYFSIYQYTSIIFSIFLFVFDKKINPFFLHATSLFLGAIGIIIFFYFDNHKINDFAMVLLGIMWGSIMTLPYVILSSKLKKTYLGTYFGLFNIAITFPQIVSGFLFSVIYHYLLNNKAVYLLYICSFFITAASFITFYYFLQGYCNNSQHLNLLYKKTKNFLIRFYLKLIIIHKKNYKKIEFNIKQKIKITVFIIFFVILGQLATAIYLPSMPMMVNYFHTSSTLVQYSLTLYFIGYGISQFIYGPVSDIYGRRLIILIGLTLFLFSLFLTLTFQSITIFLISRFMQGLGMGCGDTMGRAILCDQFNEAEFLKAANQIGMAATLTPLIAPILGGYIEEFFIWQIDFLLVFLIALLLLVLVFIYLPETKWQTNSQPLTLYIALQHYWIILKNKTFIKFFVPGLICFVFEVLYSLVMPFLVLNHFHWRPSSYGWLSILTVSGFFLGTIISQISIKKVSYTQLVFQGLRILLFSGALLTFISLFHIANPWFIVFPMFILMSGVGIIYPNTNRGALAPFQSLAGTAGALQGGCQMILGGLLGTIFSFFSLQSPLPLALCFLLFSSLGLLIFKKY